MLFFNGRASRIMYLDIFLNFCCGAFGAPCGLPPFFFILFFYLFFFIFSSFFCGLPLTLWKAHKTSSIPKLH